MSAGPGPSETQPERTALSWQRTALGALAVGGLIAHRALVHDVPALFVAAALCAVLGLALLLGSTANRDVRVREQLERGTSAGAPRLAGLATAAVVLVALAALAALVTPH